MLFQQILQEVHLKIKQINKNIKDNEIEKAHSMISRYQKQHAQDQKDDDKYENMAVLSIEGFLQSELGHNQDAIIKLKHIVQKKPYDSVSMRRLAIAYEKINKDQQALKYIEMSQILQPDNPYLSEVYNRIILKIIKKKELNQESENLLEVELAKKESKGSSHVSFGSFEVFQVATEDSDEYFALVNKQKIKITEKQEPKKSILKTSKAKTESKEQQKQQQKEIVETEEIEVPVIKKSQSLKDWKPQSQIKMEQKPKKKKSCLKKKSISFCFKNEEQKIDLE